MAAKMSPITMMLDFAHGTPGVGQSAAAAD
jgi:hypothetical protein